MYTRKHLSLTWRPCFTGALALGDLDRMYLTPEDPALRLRRKKFGGAVRRAVTEVCCFLLALTHL